MNYYDATEAMDDALLENLNNCFRWFKELRRNEDFSEIDYIATDAKGRKCAVELKHRTKDFEAFFIETRKYEALKAAYENEGLIPLYINFIDGGKKFYLWNLEKYFTGIFRKPEKKEVTIVNVGKGERQRVDRLMLPASHAAKYVLTQNNYYKRVS